MKPETIIARAAKTRTKEVSRWFVNAAEGMPPAKRATLAARVMKEVQADTMSPAELIELQRR